jgi:acetoin utilization protein AcuB
MIVSDVMTENPITASSTSTIFDVMERMAQEDIRHMPVVDRHELVGFLSDRDLRAYSFELMLEAPESAKAKLKKPVSDVMSGDVLSVEPETDLADVCDLLIENKVGAVPVVDPVEGNLVGIVSYIDVLRAARDSL